MEDAGSQAGPKKVLVLVAMEQEAMPIINQYGLRRVEPSPFVAGAPMVAHRGWYDPNAGADSIMELFVTWAGHDPRFKSNNVGTVAASVSTYASVSLFKPDLVISAGTAGGMGSMGARVGDVYLSTKCVFHARRIPEAHEGGGFEEYGFGHFRSPPLARLVAAVPGLKQGIISTGDSLDCSPTDQELMRTEGACVKEMEAAACAWVCQHARVPFFALKAITDIVDGPRPTAREFYSNLSLASSNLNLKLRLVLNELANRPLHQWRSSSLLHPLPALDAEPPGDSPGAGVGTVVHAPSEPSPGGVAGTTDIVG
eukprot:CAMPEP_0119137568 /NCGR_PEP_ID=MMETSP1310-20130426/23877_1 /TAXON_ID=464262 /ORGANISM="Genus nov. species nov., Strain RCC2339" /LENGTH=311 /DNA_ID=CAMNT_0007128671 /DNA_START=80 /DNA_END=1012 /DNA_ORIENTATION=+